MVFGWCFLALALSGQPVSAGSVLIKPEEAALPPAPDATALVSRGITRRPDVVLTSPQASVTSPFDLEFKFQAHGGSSIKPNSFRLVYLKEPNLDLTARVKPYVTANGVEMVGAEAPPGRHIITVKISDSADREDIGQFRNQCDQVARDNAVPLLRRGYPGRRRSSAPIAGTIWRRPST